MQADVSIIIIHYHAIPELFTCLASIEKFNPKTAYEIIVVDNDENHAAREKLTGIFQKTIYIKSPENSGYGAGNNLGAKQATGKYLFFLNPDTKLINNAVDILFKTINDQHNIGIIAPQLLNGKGKILPYQCSLTLTPIRAIFAHSLINRILPNNVISREFWLKDWDRKSKREVESIQGSAFMMRKDIFRKLKGFDENYFLYFEETDLCLKVRETGSKIIFEPAAKIIHFQEKSTTNKKLARQVFNRSRTYYFQKNFGITKAIIVKIIFWFLDRWKTIILIIILVLILYLFKKIKTF